MLYSCFFGVETEPKVVVHIRDLGKERLAPDARTVRYKFKY
jgi:hypothetical protein